MKVISIVCFANFCRSPVAEKILLHKAFPGLKFNSYGINPIITSHMDLRSQKYLSSIGIADSFHFPRKIENKCLEETSLFLCMDHHILMLMNKAFPKHFHKFKLFSYKDTSISIEDPYKLDEKKYIDVMKKISNVCSGFEINDFI